MPGRLPRPKTFGLRGMIGLFLCFLPAWISAGCQLALPRESLVKRDRFGESPVYDMRTGKSYMEWRYDEMLLESREEARLDEEERVKQGHPEREPAAQEGRAASQKKDSWFDAWFNQEEESADTPEH